MEKHEKVMIRANMLAILTDTPFVMMDPGNWEDIGFTEREIWVNSLGYGYIMCDEPSAVWEGEGLPKTEWLRINPKIINETLTFEDIAGTVLEELLNELWYDPDEENFSRTICNLKGLVSLEPDPCGYLYALATMDEPRYFNSEQEFKAAYERDWADVLWEDMSDDLLSVWIGRLKNEAKYDQTLAGWAQKHGLLENVDAQ